MKFGTLLDSMNRRVRLVRYRAWIRSH